jgi:GDP-L-fucose synthase
LNRGDRIYVAGHRGLVGSAIVRALVAEGYDAIVTRTRAELDLRRQEPVERFFEAEKPAYVFLAAATVGGILANATRGAEFARDNLLIQTNVIDAAYRSGVKKLLFLGSSCIYPKDAPQPIREEALLTGPLEPTNEPYAVAKIAGIRMLQAYRKQYGFNGICLMPSNLYGPGDNYDLERAHVLPALVRRFHEAKERGSEEVVVWGTGEPRREFLHVDDLARACLLAMERYDGAEVLNVGPGEEGEVTIRELAEMVKGAVGYEGRVRFDASKPDGVKRKVMDVRRMREMGWGARIGLREGVGGVVGGYRLG